VQDSGRGYKTLQLLAAACKPSPGLQQFPNQLFGGIFSHIRTISLKTEILSSVGVFSQCIKGQLLMKLNLETVPGEMCASKHQ
jgi:hypothetical protein